MPVYGIVDEATPKIMCEIMPCLRARERGGGIMQFVAIVREDAMLTYGIMNEQTLKVSLEVMPCLKARDRGNGMQLIATKGDRMNAPGQISLFDLDSWSGKTYTEPLAATREKTSASCSKKPRVSRTVMPLYLDLRKGNGNLLGASWEMGGALLGEYSTRNFGESTNVAVESSLSQILEDNPHRKYFLSAKACAGILRRAKERGKQLPPLLEAALLYPIYQTTANMKIEVCAGFKGKASQAAGSIGYQEDMSPTLVSGQEAHVMYQHKFGDYRDGIGTLKQNCGQPSNASGNIVVYGICSFASNSMKSDNPHSGIYEADTSRTLDLNGGNPACNQGGIAIIMATGQANAEITEDVCPTLNSNHEQPIVAGVDCRNYCETEQYPTLQAKNKGGTSLNYMGAVRTGLCVRRLTPLECDRLMGFPDNWTLIPKASDSARYKVDGNSVAIPCAEYVMEGIAEVMKGVGEEDARKQ